MTSLPAQRGRPTYLLTAALGGAATVGVVAIGTTVSPRDYLAACGLAAVAGLAAIASSARPASLLCLGMILTIFSGHWDYVGLPPLVTPDRLFIAAGVIAALARVPAVRDRGMLQIRPAHAVLAAFSVFALASALIADTLLGEPVEQLDRVGITAFACFLVAPLAFAERADRRLLAWTLCGLGGYLALTALLEIIAASAVFPPYIADRGVEERHFGRARGPFVEAEVNGFALFACLLGALIARAGSRRPELRAVALAVAILCAVGILLTLTRAAWLGATLGAVLAALAVPRLRRWIVPLAAAVALLVVLTFAAIPDLAQRAGERATNQETVWDRQNLNTAALNMFMDAPLVGQGWSTFQEIGNDYFWMAPTYPLNTIRARTGMHNQVLLRLSEVGLLGTALWILGVALALSDGLRGPREGDLMWWRAGLIGLVVCHLILILTTPAAHPYQLLLLMLWAGVAAGPAVLGVRDSDGRAA